MPLIRDNDLLTIWLTAAMLPLTQDAVGELLDEVQSLRDELRAAQSKLDLATEAHEQLGRILSGEAAE